jgi:hypothetical protein
MLRAEYRFPARLAGKQGICEIAAGAFDLRLGERPERDQRGAPGQGIVDLRRGEDVRRACQEELARALLAVDALLDRKQQGGRPLDLVDEDRAGLKSPRRGHLAISLAANGD